MSDTDEGLGVVIGGLAGFGLVCLTLIDNGTHAQNLNTVPSDMMKRNMDVFRQIADVQDLNAPQRLSGRWELRQRDITARIFDETAGAFRWPIISSFVDTSGKGAAAIHAADTANIALIPTMDETGKVTLSVAPTHGCVSTPITLENADIAASARKLILAFQAQATNKPLWAGHYALDGEANVTFTPLQKGETITARCPAPTL